MRGYSQFSFWISITLFKIYISCIIINRGKNTFEFVGTVLKLAQSEEKCLHLVRQYVFERQERTSSACTLFCSCMMPRAL